MSSPKSSDEHEQRRIKRDDATAIDIEIPISTGSDVAASAEEKLKLSEEESFEQKEPAKKTKKLYNVEELLQKGFLKPMKEDEEKLRNVIESCNHWIEIHSDDKTIRDGIYQVLVVAEFYFDEIIEAQKPEVAVDPRFIPSRPVSSMVSIEFEIVPTEMAHNFDLVQFETRVLQLFGWFDIKEQKKFRAPYMSFVQSSGMGKTKLLHELRHKCKREGIYNCETILCVSGYHNLKMGDKRIFTDQLSCQKSTGFRDEPPEPEELRRSIWNQLDHILSPRYGKTVVGKRWGKNIFLFDEAQNLLEKDGLFVRCVRSWLQVKRQEQQVVAVFVGTTLNLANDYGDIGSREFPHDRSITFYQSGHMLYDPFYTLCTTGCLWRSAVDASASEYRRAIPYGRPLFAVMDANNKLDENTYKTILRRMLLRPYYDDSGLQRNLDACLNILATRVQMGESSLQVVEELVARGYANLKLLDAWNGIAEMCYLPDPVCARLAMCLMDETWTTPDLLIKGEPKTFWSERLARIFSQGLCHTPEGGDAGEVVAALYLLFCQDQIRMQQRLENAERYEKFSVPLDLWVSVLLEPDETRNPITEKASMVESSLSINFIQVGRNYLKGDSKIWTNQVVLKYMYQSACAFYASPGQETIDMVASIRETKNDHSEHYLPLLISVKARQAVDQTEANAECDEMKKLLTDANIKRGMCLLIVIGGSQEGYSNSIEVNDVNTLIADKESTSEGSGIVSKVLHLHPEKDRFGLISALSNSTCAKREIAEIFLSHQFMHPLADVEPAEVLLGAQRRNANDDDEDEALNFLTSLKEDFKSSKAGSFNK